MDYSVWNPESDPHLWASYSADDPSGKEENKRRHQQEQLKLEPDPKAPLVGMISRLAEQKGFDLVMEAFDRMMAPDTVCDYEPESGEGNGFTFRDYAPEAMLAALQRAVDLYLRDPGA